MELDYVATTRQLGWAIEDKRYADEALAEARLELALARAGHMAVVDDLNELYRERSDVLASIRKDLDRPCCCEVSVSFRESYAEWLVEESGRCIRRFYFRASDAEHEAQKKVERAREVARAAGKYLYELRKAYADGLVVDDGVVTDLGGDFQATLDDYEFPCQCAYCLGLYDDDDHDSDLDEFEEEELLELAALRVKLRNKKSLAYNNVRQKRRAAHFAN